MLILLAGRGLMSHSVNFEKETLLFFLPSSFRFRWKKEWGYTLIELLVVLIIISVVAAFVIPTSMGPLSTLDLKTSTKKTAAILRYARSRATAENTFYNVHFNFSTETVVVEEEMSSKNGDGGTSLDADPSENKPESYQLPSGVRLLKCVSGETEVDNGSFTVRFNPTGSSTGGRIFFADSRNRQMSVSIDFITGSVEYNG